MEQDIKPDPKPKKRISSGTVWALKITLVTLVTAFCISFITEITASKSSVVISILLLCLLIIIAIAFDAIAVASTSCDPAPLLSMAARKVAGAKNAVILVKNAAKVSSVCGDVVGDMCGIISGTCSAAILIKLFSSSPYAFWFSMVMTTIVASITIGGKAFFKRIAITNSKELMLFAGRIIGIFYHPRKKKVKTEN